MRYGLLHLRCGEDLPDVLQVANLVLRADGNKEYMRATAADEADYAKVSATLAAEVEAEHVPPAGARALVRLQHQPGHPLWLPTWRDFFNDRQLLALRWLRAAVARGPRRRLSRREPGAVVVLGLTVARCDVGAQEPVNDDHGFLRSRNPFSGRPVRHPS
jgi:hypothetical protein